MSSMQLPTNRISHPGPIPSAMTSQTSPTGTSDADAAYLQNYMPVFPGQVEPSNQAVVSSVSHDPLAQCLSGQNIVSATAMVPSPLNSSSALGEAQAPSVITHTAVSTAPPSDAATTFCHGTDYCSISTQPTPPPPQLQPLAPLASTSVRQPQTFALPHAFRSSSAKKTRPVQRIAAATTLPSSHLILTGL